MTFGERRTRPDMSAATAQIPNMNGVDVTSTVVVVDDTAANVTLLTRLLDLAGITRVHGFTDPREAVAFCAASLPDLVLLDLHMPHLDGFAVMDSLQLMVPEDGFLPVLVLTADVNAEVRERALLAGAKDFLTKPFDRTEVLLRVANLLETRALYRRLELHNASLQATIDDHLAEERKSAADEELRHARIDAALAPGGFGIVFQPVADLTTGSVVGVEALARFGCQPHRPPNVWFGEAEHLGRGTELELAAIRAALDRMPELRPDLFLAVNVSPATAAAEELALLLDRYPSHRVVLELTEHTRVDDYDGLLAALDRLRRRGIRIAVDDTGAGYAGLQHLLRIHPHMLKLDTALTHGIDHDPVRRSLAAALVTFALETGATIIAEGIETPGELDTLQRLGIPWGQGYHLARPAELPPGLRLPTLASRGARA
jgi:EAL domain-containing protein (putative c-di-GMP-specific phosphodiesterase class I)/DNA-binding response OmpR family regulator